MYCSMLARNVQLPKINMLGKGSRDCATDWSHYFLPGFKRTFLELISCLCSNSASSTQALTLSFDRFPPNILCLVCLRFILSNSMGWDSPPPSLPLEKSMICSGSCVTFHSQYSFCKHSSRCHGEYLSRLGCFCIFYLISARSSSLFLVPIRLFS